MTMVARPDLSAAPDKDDRSEQLHLHRGRWPVEPGCVSSCGDVTWTDPGPSCDPLDQDNTLCPECLRDFVEGKRRCPTCQAAA